ncbi:TetR/AcrR family transcriptional regulator C-terminal domain-containing protein [Curtobacterium sp. VKM Ac-2887]|nr:TetR/AcrR family transcriptional regulator C-terminal domain-containing protein [Curtobacterium sp. VKM Ac-2887]
MADGTTAAPKPRRGRPPRISRASIIEAAQGLPLDELSMQAVADRLGVDRSSINYHFADRDELFAIVASATLDSALAGYRHPESDDWREWVRTYARSVHAALLQHATLALYVRLPLGADARALAPVEGTIQKMLEAGFSDETVAHAVAFVSEIVHATAQNEILVARGTHPQGPELTRFLATQSESEAPGLRRLLELDPLGNDSHFEFALRVFIAGLDAQLREQA